MKVLLKRHFYGDRLYRKKGDDPVEIPDRFKDKLPLGSVIVSDSGARTEVKPAVKPNVNKD